MVKHAVEGYQAYSEGIRRGMRVLSVNGQDISFESLENCMAKLRTAPRPVTIIFKDGIFFERKRLSYSNTDENEETTVNESFAELKAMSTRYMHRKVILKSFQGRPASFARLSLLVKFV